MKVRTCECNAKLSSLLSCQHQNLENVIVQAQIQFKTFNCCTTGGMSKSVTGLNKIIKLLKLGWH